MATYSFQDCVATLTAPGGIIALGDGAGVADEGITLEFIEEKDKLSVGADGSPMHSLNASKAGKMSVRLQKTSPTNALLTAMYNFQQNSAATWGQGSITVQDIARGDQYSGQQVAFLKVPTNNYPKEAGMLEWEFLIGILDVQLGPGSIPGIN